jgi:hypothetical protein
MKPLLSVAVVYTLLIALEAPTLALATELKDLKPNKEEQAAAAASAKARADDAQMKKIYVEQQEKNRVKSDAERTTQQIPKKTTITPTYPPGVKVTIPTE